MNPVLNSEVTYNTVTNIKDEEIYALLEGFVSSDQLNLARQLLNLIRNNRIQTLSSKVVRHIIDYSLDEKSKSRLKEVCILLLDHLVNNINLKDSINNENLEDSTYLLLTQELDMDYEIYIMTKLLEALENPQVSISSKLKILPFFSRIGEINPSCLTSDAIQSISLFMLQWLNGNSSTEAFSKINYTELDGTPSRDLFTVLNQTASASNETMLHNQMFSMIRLWLHNCHGLRLVDESSVRSAVPLPSGMVGRIIEYSIRIVDQANRIASRPQDADYQNSCLLESLKLLNMMCLYDASHIPVVHHVTREVFIRNFVAETSNVNIDVIPIILECLQFFINHGHVVEFDVQSALDSFVLHIENDVIMDGLASNEITEFIHLNIQDLSHKYNILEKFFPHLLKMFAWHPGTLLPRFEVILPAMTSYSTCVEVFHAVIDLPCITAALILQNYGSANCDSLSQTNQIYEASLEWQYKPMFNYILRCESGFGDTFSRVGDLHKLLEPIINHPRMVQCAQNTVNLIEVYAALLLQYINEDISIQIIPAILERSLLILPIDNFAAKIQLCMENILREVVTKFPSFIATYQKEFLDYISNVRHLSFASNIYLLVVWLVGEFTSSIYLENCQSDLIDSSYQCLECALFEIVASNCFETLTYKVICMLSSSLTKLASRCQDLIPRVKICLTKLLDDTGLKDNGNQESVDIMCDRIKQYLALLNMPNITYSILSPSKDIETGIWHRDCCSTISLMKAISSIHK